VRFSPIDACPTEETGVRRHRVATVVAVGSAALLTLTAFGATAQAATAHRSWFHDPVSATARHHEVAVPRHPTGGGRLKHTKATDRTAEGKVAVPVAWAHGHQLGKGQAVVLNGRSLFRFDTATPTRTARQEIHQLRGSLKNATAVRCEGFADFGAKSGHEMTLSRHRATRVCSLLHRADPALAVHTRGYGDSRPVVIGSTRSHRKDNRRVVIVVTHATVPAPPTSKPSGPSAPSAPTITNGTVEGFSIVQRHHVVDLSFTPATDDHGSAITGYQYSEDGSAWTSLTYTAGSPDTTTIVTPFDYCDNLHTTFTIRAVNGVGGGALSNAYPIDQDYEC
jgi:outer membrane protein OmpA-like peptidoglycan-associated protein